MVVVQDFPLSHSLTSLTLIPYLLYCSLIDLHAHSHAAFQRFAMMNSFFSMQCYNENLAGIGMGLGTRLACGAFQQLVLEVHVPHFCHLTYHNS